MKQKKLFEAEKTKNKNKKDDDNKNDNIINNNNANKNKQKGKIYGKSDKNSNENSIKNLDKNDNLNTTENIINKTEKNKKKKLPPLKNTNTEKNENLKSENENENKKEENNNENNNNNNINTIPSIKNTQPSLLKINRKKPTKLLKIIFIFRRNQYTINLKQNSKISQLRQSISNEIHLEPSNFEIFFNDEIIPESQDQNSLSQIIKNQRFFFFEVKKKITNNYYKNYILPKTYNYKIFIENIENLPDFYLKIEQFFKDSLIEKDYILEPIEMNKYSLGFSFPDVAFDFNRFLLILKLSDENYANIKSSLKLDGTKNKKISNRNFLKKKIICLKLKSEEK